MSQRTGQKKVLVFGFLGVLGCLVGWAVGDRMTKELVRDLLQRPAALHEELEHVVEYARVALPRLDHGFQLADLLPEEGRGHRLFPGVHLVDVAAQR